MKSKLFFSFLCMALVLCGELSAQNESNSSSTSTGKITGTVVDAETGETLIGVNVVLQSDPSKGTATDLDGRYTISNLQPGTYNLIATYVSFARQTITGIEVAGGETVKIDIALQSETEQLEDVVITAEAILNNEAGLLRQRQKSIAFSDAVSSTFLSESGVGDAASAMEKVTGASVVGGKHVYVRGLGDRYSNVQMNGIELPSTDPDKKSFHLDLIPASLLDNITTLKTFTPDKPGNFSGGLVDINTRTYPENLLLKFSVSTTYNSQASFNSNFLSGKSYGDDRLAFGGNSREIPAVFRDTSLVIPNEVQARRSDSLAAIVQNTSKAFSSEMAPERRSVPVDESYSLAIGNQIPLFGKSLGYVASGTYNRSYTFYNDGETGRYNLTDPNADQLTAGQRYTDSEGSEEVNIGGIVNLQYKLSQNNKVGFNVFYTQIGTNTGRYQRGIWPHELGQPQEGLYQERFNYVNSYRERNLASFQLTGDHYFENLLGARIDWKLSRAKTKQSEPDLRFVSYYAAQNFVGADTNYVIQTAGFNDPSRIFRDLEETNDNASLDVEVPFQLLSSQTSKLKLGGAITDTDRSFREDWFFIDPDNGIFNSLNGNVGAFFNDQYMGVIDTTSGVFKYQFGNIVTDNTQPENNYDGKVTVKAAYGMLELPLTDRFKVIGGVRVERASYEVGSIDPDLPRSDTVNTDWLPSVNLVYSVNENMNIRGAWTKTLARPNMREVAEYSSFQFIGDYQLRGNPDLSRTLIHNYDLRWEWFPRPGEVLAVSGFYKRMENPIEVGVAPESIPSNLILEYLNVDEAQIIGLEIEARKNLDFISNATRFLNLGFNLSLVDSEVDIPYTDRRQRADTTITKRDLQGQSPYIFNVNLTYDNPRVGLNTGLYYNIFGSRLSNVGYGTTPDVYERSRPQLDFVAAKSIADKWNISLKVKNILMSEYRWEYEFKGNNTVYQSYNKGITTSLSLSYEF